MGTSQPDQLSEIRNDVKTILVVQGQQAVVQAKHTVILEEHVRRTDLLETLVNNTRAELKPLTDRVVVRQAFTRIGGMILALITAGGAVGAAVAEILHVLRK